MGFVIKRLYIENYKLFDYQEIEFNNYTLSVFDGPNGYGKTSIFDAMEFLITGTISRISDSSSILGTAAYDTIFLAKNSKKDVFLKGEFADALSSESIVLGIKIKSSNGSSKENNPKKIFEKAENYFLPSYNILQESWAEYKVSAPKMQEYREQYFGQQNINQFTVFHYVRQEDRLSYFKKSEKDRSEIIQNFLGIEEECSKQIKVEKAKKKLQNKLKEIDTEIDNLEQKLYNKPQLQQVKVEYKKLMEKDYPWDNKEIRFDSEQSSLLDKYIYDLDCIKMFIEYKEWHDYYKMYKIWMSIREDRKKNIAYFGFNSKNSEENIIKLEQDRNLCFRLEKQKQLIDENKILEINYLFLSDKLELGELEKSLNEKINFLKTLKNSQDLLQKSIIQLLENRRRLHDIHQKQDKVEKCPYCGYDWKDKEMLEKHYIDVEKNVHQLLDNEGEQYDIMYEELRVFIQEYVYPRLQQEISNIKENPLFAVYTTYNSREDFSKDLSKFTDLMSLIDPKQQNDISKENYEVISLYVEESYQKIPLEYFQIHDQYEFSSVENTYFTTKSNCYNLTEEDIEKKKEYLKYKYYESFDKLSTNLTRLKTQRVKLNNLYVKMKTYNVALKEAIGKYEKQIIDQIEIPFFVYSSRLLQSYQGGQGILMKSHGRSIRFTSPNSEHDVLYTMSSGQLSAILLAFALAMNKIYSGDGIKTMFIDDPIQCMDDINMISFVELLRREFSEDQIIVSTHEDSFANYIRYKFSKYHIETQALTLKDM